MVSGAKDVISRMRLSARRANTWFGNVRETTSAPHLAGRMQRQAIPRGYQTYSANIQHAHNYPSTKLIIYIIAGYHSPSSPEAPASGLSCARCCRVGSLTF